MTPTQRLEQFVNDVYLTRYNRFVDGITDEDGIVEIAKTIRYTNMFKDELENETDWNYSRQNNLALGTIAAATQTFTLPVDVRKLITNEYRPATIKFDTAVVSAWDVVSAGQITDPVDYSSNDRITVIGSTVIFSRPLRQYELGGTLVADVIKKLPELTLTDITLLDTVKPYQLLVLGVAKNATLPDIVQGGLSPSFVQKYGDLLERAKMENEMTGAADQVERQSFSDIGGIY